MRKMLPIPDYRDGLTSVFDRMMRRMENESNDKKHLEQQYNRSLSDTETEKKLMEIKLRNKTKELQSINETFNGNRVIILLSFLIFHYSLYRICRCFIFI